MSPTPSDYWSGLIEFHQQEAETVRAEVTRLRAVIAEAETYISHDYPIPDEQGKWPAGIRFAYNRIRPILAKATQTGEGEGR